VLVYGDTNSTIAGALVASKLHMPLAHIEAGLRSFNRTMPEEINRVVTDRLSSLLFCPTQTAVDNLRDEGIRDGVHLTGDVMLDATLLFADLTEQRSGKTASADHPPGSYFLATIHRAENTDVRHRLEGIFVGLGRIGSPVVVPLHPRTRERLAGISIPENVQITNPTGYLSMLSLIKHARGVLTDSGGLQKEAVWLGVPCVTLRDETEWVETTERGWNRVVGADPDRIAAAVTMPPEPPPPVFTEPGAAIRIVELLTS
jgi:UDP-GlcNAc3NAcA epimerase